MVGWLVGFFVLVLAVAVFGGREILRVAAAEVLWCARFAVQPSGVCLFARSSRVASCSEIKERARIYISHGSADCCSGNQEQEQEQGKVNGGASLH